MTIREIEHASAEDQELSSVRQCLLNQKWNTMAYKSYIPIRLELRAVGQVVLRGTRIVIPTSLRGKVIEIGHEGHPGIILMKQRLRTKVWWPGMDKDIERYCKSCYGCQMIAQPPKPEPMTRSELPVSACCSRFIWTITFRR